MLSSLDEILKAEEAERAQMPPSPKVEKLSTQETPTKEVQPATVEVVVQQQESPVAKRKRCLFLCTIS